MGSGAHAISRRASKPIRFYDDAGSSQPSPGDVACFAVVFGGAVRAEVGPNGLDGTEAPNHKPKLRVSRPSNQAARERERLFRGSHCNRVVQAVVVAQGV